MLGGREDRYVRSLWKGSRSMEHVSEFTYLGFVLDDLGTDGAERYGKMGNGRKVVDAIRYLVSSTRLQFENAEVLHEGRIVFVLMYGSEKI